MRGEVKTKIRPLITPSYNFNISHSSKSREHNLKKAAALKENLNFTYKVNRGGFTPLRSTVETCAGSKICIPRWKRRGTEGAVPEYHYTEGHQRGMVRTS
jgi:Domain of unknown function (DUF6532)